MINRLQSCVQESKVSLRKS